MTYSPAKILEILGESPSQFEEPIQFTEAEVEAIIRSRELADQSRQHERQQSLDEMCPARINDGLYEWQTEKSEEDVFDMWLTARPDPNHAKLPA